MKRSHAKSPLINLHDFTTSTYRRDSRFLENTPSGKQNTVQKGCDC